MGFSRISQSRLSLKLNLSFHKIMQMRSCGDWKSTGKAEHIVLEENNPHDIIEQLYF